MAKNIYCYCVVKSLTADVLYTVRTSIELVPTCIIGNYITLLFTRYIPFPIIIVSCYHSTYIYC